MNIYVNGTSREISQQAYENLCELKNLWRGHSGMSCRGKMHLGFVCTLPDGHAGAHIAGIASGVIAISDQEEQ